MNLQFLTNHKNDDNYIGEILEQLFEQSKYEILIVAPYISMNPLIEKISNLKVKKIKILTKLSLYDFLTNASDLDVVSHLLEQKQVEIRYFSNLHAKVYMFDNKQAVVTSANFTNNGFFHNLEYGVLIKEGIEQISNDLSSLWYRAAIVNRALLREVKNELLAVQKKKEVTAKVKKELHLVNKEVIIPKISHQIQSKIKIIDESVTMDEQEALYFVIKQSNLSREDARKLKLVYEMIKRNIPEEVRSLCSFRYTLKNKANIACNIMNYRIFLLPYRKDNLVQLIYPSKEVMNLATVLQNERRKNLKNWVFKSFDGEIVKFTMNEILQFHDTQWQSFKKACLMAFHARKSRQRENNISVKW